MHSALALTLLCALVPQLLAATLVRKTIRVAYATQGEAYFDMGLADGLQAMQVITLSRKGRTFGKCQLTEVSEKSSVCAIQGARIGDTAEVTVGPRMGATTFKPAERLTPAHEKRRTWIRVSQAPLPPKVLYIAKAMDERPREITAQVHHQSWSQNGSRTSGYQLETLDVGLRHIPLSKRLEAHLDTRTWMWTARPESARFRPNRDVQLYVFEAAVRTKDTQGWHYGAGRLRVGELPGLVMLDGATLGYRFESGSQVGLFAGTLPDMVSLAPSLDAWTAGVYTNTTLALNENHSLRHLLRLGPRYDDDFEMRLEAQSLLAWDIGRSLSVWADALAGAGGTQASGLDALRSGLTWQTSPNFLLSTQFRKLWRQRPEDLTAGITSTHADVYARVGLTQRLSLTPRVGRAFQSASDGASHSYFGLDVERSEWFARPLTLRVGYQEDFGWLTGRQFFLNPYFIGARVHGNLRTQVAFNEHDGVSNTEYAMSGAVGTPLWKWLSAHVQSLIQWGDTPRALTASLGLNGNF